MTEDLFPLKLTPFERYLLADDRSLGRDIAYKLLERFVDRLLLD